METLTRDGAVVAFPQGSVRSGSGYEWDLEGDAPFLHAVVDGLLDQFPGSHPQICISGMSGGARMSSRFASRHPERVLLLGAVAGLRAPVRRALARPVPVVAFHGTADRINPLNGGATARWEESVLDAAKGWAAADGLSEEPTSDEVTSELTRFRFGSEEDPATVTLWVSRGAGHTWPGSRLPMLLRLFLGRTSHEIDATAEIWRSATTLAGNG